MSKPEKKTYLPSQRFIGKQVVDVKGSLVGNVKDLAVSVGELDLALVVSTKTAAEIQIPWSEIQSIEDVVLLNRGVDLPKVAESSPASSTPKITSICSSCKANIPSHAKFCPKCGARLPS